MFDTPEAAAHAYDQAASKMHGPEAYTNFLCKQLPAAARESLFVVFVCNEACISPGFDCCYAVTHPAASDFLLAA